IAVGPSCLYSCSPSSVLLFFFTAPAPPEIYTLSLHDALPISCKAGALPTELIPHNVPENFYTIPYSREPVNTFLFINPLKSEKRSEEHTSELQSRFDLVCRLLLEKKK